jgi:uncharacterized membrane protein
MTTPIRLTREQVAGLRMTKPSDISWVTLEELCDSHETYRGFAQDFLDIMAGTKEGEIATIAAEARLTDRDRTMAQLFALFLRVVAPATPRA